MPNRAFTVASSGNNNVIAGVSGKKIRVHGFAFTVDNAVTVQMLTFAANGSSSVTFSGAMAFGTTGDGMALYAKEGLFVCTGDQPFMFKLGTAVGVNGFINYELVGQ